VKGDEGKGKRSIRGKSRTRKYIKSIGRANHGFQIRAGLVGRNDRGVQRKGELEGSPNTGCGGSSLADIDKLANFQRKVEKETTCFEDDTSK